MIFRNRKITFEDGGVEIKLSLRFSPEELGGMKSITDDPNATFSGLRIEGDQAQRVDHYLCFLRVMAHYADIWENRDSLPEVIQQFQGKKAIVDYRGSQPKKRKKR